MNPTHPSASPPPKAILWDMDGTLVDSLGHHWDAWRDMASARGFDVTHERFLSTLGRRNEEILAEWFGAAMSPGDRDRLALEKEELYRHYIRTKGIDPLPGVRAWMARFREDGWKQAIGTMAPRLNEEAVIEALGLASWFDARVAAEDVQRGKPSPDVFLLAAERVGVPPERAIVIEDAALGVEAGRAAGMKTVAVNPRGPIAGADLCVRSLLELPPDAFNRLLDGH